MHFKLPWIWAVIVGTIGCSQSNSKSDDATKIASRCSPSAVIVVEGGMNCLYGDPAVLAALPNWAKPPAAVKVRSTQVFRTNDLHAIGYRAEFRGPLSAIEPAYRDQLRSVPDMKWQHQGNLLIARLPESLNPIFISLLEQSVTTGEKVVEIDVQVGPIWKAGEPRPWASEE